MKVQDLQGRQEPTIKQFARYKIDRIHRMVFRVIQSCFKVIQHGLQGGYLSSNAHVEGGLFPLSAVEVQ